MKRALLVIAKRPRSGQTKTRLTPPLSAEQASQLYECFLRDTLDLVRAVPEVTHFILYTPPHESAYFTKLAPDFALLAQSGNSLGERLDKATNHCLHNGFSQVVIINSDGPTLSSVHVAQAFVLLQYLRSWQKPDPKGFRKWVFDKIKCDLSRILTEICAWKPLGS